MTHHPEMANCMEECQQCHNICLETLAHCLTMGGAHAEASHINLLIDCAEICQTSANFLLRDSTMHTRTCGACADVCEHCAASCEKMGEDAQMKECAKACRRCAESCRKMAA